MSPYDWNREIADIHRRMNKWLEHLSPRRVSSCFSGDPCWTPAADVQETEHSYHVFLDVAGVDPSCIEVVIDGDTLRVSGVRRRPRTRTCTRIHQLEIDYGEFNRLFRFPAELDSSGAISNYDLGMLEITLPKLRKHEAVQIQVKSE